MEELIYLLKVADNASARLAQILHRAKGKTSHVRLATMAPLSNFGFPAGAEGGLLAIVNEGVVVGVEGNDEAPSLFVPWQNIAYLADGSKLAKSKAS